MPSLIDDVKIANIRPLLPPAILIEELPVEQVHIDTISESRAAAARIISGEDDRLLVITGPCSIHDPQAGREYAEKLRVQAEALSKDLLIMMRVYFEKPRTTVGWKGLINDPHLDGSFAINEGLRLARRLLLDVTGMGLPVGTEFLDPITPQFVADLMCWGAIGARTTESQVHRELASGLSAPVGFKNGTDGNIQIAIDAIGSSRSPHQFLSVTKQGLAAIVETRGNADCHVILRGGNNGPNFDADSVSQVCSRLKKAGLTGSVMVDCSHANSGKDHNAQPAVASEIAKQVAGGSRQVFGVMLESFLEAGRQDVVAGQELTYGQSITDACMSWDATLPVLEELAAAVAKRRKS
ncbi:MAG: 3-deoxy-7-phosphoheptulonate synthase [Deltaproteobacteria bacterium]|nr:3-deoxy-7-phosphoheptulonate synthase [Deltaproteobacteria bacterium]